MIKIKNPHDLIIGKTYKIIFPCYDDYDDGLESEVDVVIVTEKNKSNILAHSMNSDNTYSFGYRNLLDYEIFEY